MNMPLAEPPQQAAPDAPSVASDFELKDIAVGDIDRSPYQPRLVFDEVALEELANSIATVGLVKPLLVRPVADGRFELVGGERRWRAHKLLGRKTVTAIVRQLDDEAAAIIALTDNEQEDLTDFEHGIAYWRLLREGSETSKRAIARSVGISHSTVIRRMQFSELPEWVIDGLKEKPSAISFSYVSKFIVYCRDHEEVAKEIMADLFEGKLSQEQALRAIEKRVNEKPKGEQSTDYLLRGIGSIRVNGRKIELKCEPGVDMIEINKKIITFLDSL